MAKRRRQLPVPDDVLSKARDRIDHVIVLMLENRSFDHLLGFLDHPDPNYPGLRGKSFPNPLDLDDPLGPTQDVSPDAQYVLSCDPPHGHESIKLTMNGRRWRDFRMNGFVAAFARKLAGHEPIAFIYWDRVHAAGIVVGGVAAAALVNFWHLFTEGGWGGYAKALLVVGTAGGALGSGLKRVGAMAGKERLVTTLIGGASVVVPAAGQALWHRLYGLWPGFVGTWAVLIGVSVVAVQRRRAAMRQVARVPLADVPDESRKVMRCLAPDKIPVLGELARQFVVCTNWHSSVPGATWPNRQFLHAATSAGAVDIDIGLYGDTTIFDQLGPGAWRIYHDGMAQVMCYEHLWKGGNEANWFPMRRFFEDVAPGGRGLPAYTFIEPNHGGPRSNSQHPGNNQRAVTGPTDFERGERLVGQIYEALRSNADLFRKTVLLISYDEHGGLFDNQPPPRLPAPGTGTLRNRFAHISRRFVAWFVENRTSPFDFRRAGIRVPTIVVSPWVETATWDPTPYDHTSVISSLRPLFTDRTDALSGRDAAANHFLHLVTTRATARDPMPVISPPPAPALAPEELEPAPEAPPVGAPVTVSGDIRDQLAFMATKVDQQLAAEPTAPPAPTPAESLPAAVARQPAPDTVSRFEAYASQARGGDGVS